MRVVIVDDSEVMRKHLADALSGLDGVVIAGNASNGAQALESIRELAPDVVVLDIRMQSGNGIEVLQRIRQDGSCPVVIMFTNYPFPQYRKKCEQAGADFFFDKSSESHRVIETMEYLAGRFNAKE